MNLDPHRFRPPPARQPGKVLFVGRLLPHKGLEYLIEALDGPLTLTVVGPAPGADYLDPLRRQAAGKPVTFAGAVGDGALVEHYRSAIATVLPSVYVPSDGARSGVPELLGLTVLESLACGTPAVVTNVASLPETVEDHQTGFIVPPNDPGAIREHLHYLVDRPDEVERMGQAGRARVLEQFSWDATVDRCFSQYVEASRRRRPHG